MWIYEKELRRNGRKILEREVQFIGLCIYAYSSSGDHIEKNEEIGTCSMYGGE
jgi:hypothetical protein